MQRAMKVRRRKKKGCERVGEEREEREMRNGGGVL